MIEHDEEWFYYYEGVLKGKPEYKVGHALRPNHTGSGYAVIAKVLSTKQWGSMYTLITDFGNKIVLSERELDQSFTVIGWQDVIERAKEQQELLERSYYDVFGNYLSNL